MLRHAKDHFIPHEGNNHTPHVLKHRALLGYSVILILLKALVVLVPLTLPSSYLYSSAINTANIVTLTNQTRENLGLPVLHEDPLLASAAYAKAQAMLEDQYFAHVAPDGTTAWDYIRSVGYDYEYAGENLAVYFTTAEDLQDGWLASPTHRENIVSTKYTEIGVGVAHGTYQGHETTMVVELFGAPAGSVESATLASETTNPPAEEPAPVAESGEAGSGSAGEPVVDTSSVVIVPEETDAYSVEVTVTEAESVAVQLGSEWVPLEEEGETDVWSGTVAYNPAAIDEDGEDMFLLASGDEPGEDVVEAIAVAAPETGTQDLYVFTENPDKSYRFLGFLTVRNIDDKVGEIYLGTIVVLAAALMIGVMMKLHARHPSIVAHSIVVILLAAGLFAI